ncbi:FR47-like protein [Mucilaginibacter pineti]|uniref:FR47-like protein n=1 Tax=Mucilaginibacter pineti TaxID=1391627 RepID=A0A1G6TAK8_9SPHI|nr:GNAT family N-acetyltransferase [Mucilaginibacter pineti]SDD25507.1 FR47-like protein [Mucilaginibacter pineti]
MKPATTPEITFIPATTIDHFEQIIALQKQNLYSAISTEQQTQEGFVFAEHTVSLLQFMAAEVPQVIALHNNKVIGYNLAMTVSMEKELHSLEPMFQEFSKSLYQGKLLSSYNFFVGGQVCVDKNFRGLGLLSKLYHATAEAVSPRYQLCVTEVSVRNTNSLKAHQKMGFEVISTYHDGKELWNVIAWDIRK